MYIDIHSHIIPGIDDGAENNLCAMEMLRIADCDDTSLIFATPHFISGTMQNTASIIGELCCELQQMAFDNCIGVKILPGSEVYISPDIPELFDKGEVSTLNGSIYILVEFPMSVVPRYVDEVLFKLQLRGLTPIIAHPERNSIILRNKGILMELVRRGMLVQINSGSVTGLYGKKIKKFSLSLIKAGMVHFVASDSHSCTGRTPQLGKAAHLVEKKFGKKIADELFYKNGWAVFENRSIPVREYNEAGLRSLLVSIKKLFLKLINH